MNKVAFVTGAARRIGRAIALELAAASFDVALHFRQSRDHAEALAAEIARAGRRAALVSGDLGDANALPGLIAQAAGALGPLTALVNNASLFEPDEAISLDPDQWDRHIAVNLRAPVILARHFAAQLPVGAEGAIVNLVDQRVMKPTPSYFSYSISKAGLWAATRTLAQSLAPRIRVNAVGPGPTLPNLRQTDEAFRLQQEAVLLGHGATPGEIAAAVRFLIEAPSITGQLLLVDGGQHLAWETPERRRHSRIGSRCAI